MPSMTVRISGVSHDILRKLAIQEGESMQTILEKAIENYRRRRFLEEVNRAYAALRQEPETWAAVEKERAEWEITLQDGLESDGGLAENEEAICKDKREKGL